MTQLFDTISDVFADENLFDRVTSDRPGKIPPFINTVNTIAINTIYRLSFLKLSVKIVSFD